MDVPGVDVKVEAKADLTPVVKAGSKTVSERIASQMITMKGWPLCREVIFAYRLKTNGRFSKMSA